MTNHVSGGSLTAVVCWHYDGDCRFRFRIGVFWELIEHGWRDTVIDLCFDIVGGFLVIGVELPILMTSLVGLLSSKIS